MESWSTVFDDGGKCLYFVSVCDQLINGCTILTEINAITIHIAFFTILKKKSLKIQFQLQCTWCHSCSIFFSVMTYWRIQTVKSIPDQNL